MAIMNGKSLSVLFDLLIYCLQHLRTLPGKHRETRYYPQAKLKLMGGGLGQVIESECHGRGLGLGVVDVTREGACWSCGQER